MNADVLGTGLCTDGNGQLSGRTRRAIHRNRPHRPWRSATNGNPRPKARSCGSLEEIRERTCYRDGQTLTGLSRGRRNHDRCRRINRERRLIRAGKRRPRLGSPRDGHQVTRRTRNLVDWVDLKGNSAAGSKERRDRFNGRRHRRSRACRSQSHRHIVGTDSPRRKAASRHTHKRDARLCRARRCRRRQSDRSRGGRLHGGHTMHNDVGTAGHDQTEEEYERKSKSLDDRRTQTESHGQSSSSVFRDRPADRNHAGEINRASRRAYLRGRRNFRNGSAAPCVCAPQCKSSPSVTAAR